jgi:hypothetical protein
MERILLSAFLWEQALEYASTGDVNIYLLTAHSPALTPGPACVELKLEDAVTHANLGRIKLLVKQKIHYIRKKKAWLKLKEPTLLWMS